MADDDTKTFRAKLSFSRITPQKMRYVGDMIRDHNVMDAQNILADSSKRGAYFLDKLLRSAVSNAEYEITEKGWDINPERLVIDTLRIDKGTTYKRWMPRARGRATAKNKKTTHVEMILSPEEDS
jgi:large subunit ribosomal protein L22